MPASVISDLNLFNFIFENSYSCSLLSLTLHFKQDKSYMSLFKWTDACSRSNKFPVCLQNVGVSFDVISTTKFYDNLYFEKLGGDFR